MSVRETYDGNYVGDPGDTKPVVDSINQPLEPGRTYTATDGTIYMWSGTIWFQIA